MALLPPTGDQLAYALQVLGVNFILGGQRQAETLHQQPARLIAALVQSHEARLRLALIPLLLKHPEFSAYVCAVGNTLDPAARLTLQCYYSATVWLQQKYRLQLNKLLGETPTLPDYFSHELGAPPTSDPAKNLELLAQRHQALSGTRINWLGTYQHAVQVWLKGLELQQR